MLTVVLSAAGLAALTVVVHATGFALLVGAWSRARAALPVRPWPTIWFLIRATWCVLLIHLVEISIWALFYLWARCFDDVESAFYFSGVTYATVGYGDLVLPERWRLLAPVQGLTGILMCGLSTGLFVALAHVIYAARSKPTSG